MKRWGRPVNFAAFVALTISIIAGIVDVNAAEMDLATVLVGRWEGELAQSKRGRGADPPERTLVINSVMKTDSGWIVDARYGITGRGLGRVEVTLDSTAGAPT